MDECRSKVFAASFLFSGYSDLTQVGLEGNWQESGCWAFPRPAVPRESKDAAHLFVFGTPARRDREGAFPPSGSAGSRADGDPLAQEQGRDARTDRRVGRGVAFDGAADA